MAEDGRISFPQEILCSEETGSAIVRCMRRCAVSSDWHVHLCLDGVAKYTLDSTYRWIDGQLPFFPYPSPEDVPHSVLKVFMSGVMVIFQVAFLYLADWYVHPNLKMIVASN